MATSKTSDHIAKSIAASKIVTFRLLSRELSIHVNEAKNELASYYTKNVDGPNRAYATYLVSGEVAAPLPPAAEPSSSVESSETSQPQAGPSTASERRIVLASEDDLETVKQKFTKILFVHVYSLSPSVIKDAALLTTPTETVREIDGKKGLEHVKKVGMMVAPDVKWVASTAKTIAKAQPLKVRNTATEPQLAKPPPPLTGPKKANTLDWSKGKSKGDAKKEETKLKEEPKVKKEESTPKPSGKLDFGKQKPKPVSKDEKQSEAAGNTAKAPSSKTSEVKAKEEPAAKSKPEVAAVAKIKAEESSSKPAGKPTSAKPASKQTSMRPASKQAKPTEKPAAPPKVGTKRASPPSDEEEESEVERPKAKRRLTEEASTAASSRASSASAAPRVQKGRVLSDDENEDDGGKPVKAPTKKRKSQAIVDDDEEEGDMKRSRLAKGKSAAEGNRQAKDQVKEKLKALITDDDDEEISTRDNSVAGDDEEAESGNDSAPEHVPLTKKYKGMPKTPKTPVEKPTGVDVKDRQPKKKGKAPLGSNGKPKKRVIRNRMTKLPNGSRKVEDYSSYESASDSEPDKEKEKEKKTREEKKPASTDKSDGKTASTKPKARKSMTSGTASGSESKSKPPLTKKKSEKGLGAYFMKKSG